MGPCKNEACHSFGRPHPNCQCYGYAEGGTVSKCSPKAHQSGCQFYEGGGGVDPSGLPPSAPQAAPAQAPVSPDAAPSNYVPIYDISGPTPVPGDMHPDDVHEAVASGKFSFPKGQVNVFDPDGNLGTIDATEAPQAFRDGGYRYATPDAVDTYTHSTPGQQAIAGVEGAAKGLIGPLAPEIEEKLGVTSGKDILSREKNNPWTHGLAETGTLLGGSLLGTGEGALLGNAGEAAAKLLGPKGASAMAKIGARTVSDAAQMLLYQGGNEVSKMVEGDPNQSIGSAAANVGLSGLIGGGAGAALGAVSPLWDATVGSKAGQLVEDFKGRLNFLKNNPDPVQSFTDELGNHMTQMGGAADDVYGATGLKAKGISAAMPELNDKMSSQAQQVADNLSQKIEGMKAAPDKYPSRLVNRLQGDYDNYLSQVTHPDAGSNEIFNAGQDLKQKLRGTVSLTDSSSL